MTARLVVIGGDAAGMSAASQAKRLRGDDLEVVALERGHQSPTRRAASPTGSVATSSPVDDLVARTPEEHRKRGIDLRMRHEVTAIDVDRAPGRPSATRERATSYTLDFDQLVIATGAVPGATGPARRRRRRHLRRADAGRRRAVIDGAAARSAEHGGRGRGGLHRHRDGRGDGAPRVVGHGRRPGRRADDDARPGHGPAGARRDGGHGHRRAHQVRASSSFVVDAGRVRGVVVDGETIPADIVVLGIGVRPNTALAEDAGLPLGETGGLRVDRRMRVVGRRRASGRAATASRRSTGCPSNGGTSRWARTRTSTAA